MRKYIALCVVLAGGIMVSLTGCSFHTPKDSASSDVVREISLNNTEEPAETADAATPNPTKDSSASPHKKSYPKIVSHARVESFGGTIKVGRNAYELYNYVDSSAKSYAKVVNSVANQLKGKAKVYDMVVPTSIGITLPDNKASKINSSHQGKSIKSLYKKLNQHVISVSLYDTLMSHRKEYIYYRTDHHWTSRGAYYAYRQFCKEKDWQAHEMSEYKTANFGSFLGSFYMDTNKNKSLRKDVVKAYYPVSDKKLEMVYYDEHGGKYDSAVISNGKNYSIQLKYCAFLSGDNPYSVIKNKKIHDGSSCLVVKESYGNTLIPYLADHYQKIYVVDYRYWKGSIGKLARKNKVQDVIFVNNISMTRNAYLIGKLAQVK